MKNNKRAFTLIELLVVVLIIGILSAIALPQYEKAVEKSRLSEAISNLNSLQKALDLYTLTTYIDDGSEELVGLSGTGAVNVLDIDLESGLDCSVQNGDKCASKNFVYDAYSEDGNYIAMAFRTKSAANNHADIWDYYSLSVVKSSQTGPWEKKCNVLKSSKEGTMVCNMLKNDGWSVN